MPVDGNCEDALAAVRSLDYEVRIAGLFELGIDHVVADILLVNDRDVAVRLVLKICLVSVIENNICRPARSHERRVVITATLRDREKCSRHQYQNAYYKSCCFELLVVEDKNWIDDKCCHAEYSGEQVMREK